jgi:hypothetical protein
MAGRPKISRFLIGISARTDNNSATWGSSRAGFLTWSTVSRSSAIVSRARTASSFSKRWLAVSSRRLRLNQIFRCLLRRRGGSKPRTFAAAIDYHGLSQRRASTASASKTPASWQPRQARYRAFSRACSRLFRGWGPCITAVLGRRIFCAQEALPLRRRMGRHRRRGESWLPSIDGGF